MPTLFRHGHRSDDSMSAFVCQLSGAHLHLADGVCTTELSWSGPDDSRLDGLAHQLRFALEAHSRVIRLRQRMQRSEYLAALRNGNCLSCIYMLKDQRRTAAHNSERNRLEFLAIRVTGTAQFSNRSPPPQHFEALPRLGATNVVSGVAAELSDSDRDHRTRFWHKNQRFLDVGASGRAIFFPPTRHRGRLVTRQHRDGMHCD